MLGLVRTVEAPPDPDLLVGFDTADDAAVYRLRDDLAIVVTTDFFTPIVDDPYDWGRIAATNALSDVYAMGGAPVLALNLVAWPREGLPFDLLARVLDGGADVVRAAGALVGGGHSIDDPEPKFGLAVVGTVDPAHVFTNRGARDGDALVLTKPIGLGVISTAVKRDAAPAALVDEAIRVMTTLNAGARRRRARDRRRGARGHRRHRLRAARPPARGARRVGSRRRDRPRRGAGDRRRARARRRRHGRGRHPAQPRVRQRLASAWNGLAEAEQLLLADAQTSGGLLVAVAPDRVDDLVARARRAAARSPAQWSAGRSPATAGTVTIRG